MECVGAARRVELSEGSKRITHNKPMDPRPEGVCGGGRRRTCCFIHNRPIFFLSLNTRLWLRLSPPTLCEALPTTGWGTRGLGRGGRNVKVRLRKGMRTELKLVERRGVEVGMLQTLYGQELIKYCIYGTDGDGDKQRRRMLARSVYVVILRGLRRRHW